jgi:hypothetical protein
MSRARGAKIDRTQLRHEMFRRALTTEEIAVRARLSLNTIKSVLSGNRADLETLHRIGLVLDTVQPVPGIDAILAAIPVKAPTKAATLVNGATAYEVNLPIHFEPRWLRYTLATDAEFRREYETAMRTWLRDPSGLMTKWNAFREEHRLRAINSARSGRLMEISSTDTSEWQLLCIFLSGEEARFVKLAELRAAEAATTVEASP